MNIIIKVFVVFAISNLFTNVIFGESASLQILITKAKQNNPEIIAAREKWNATKSKILQERTFENPQFFIDYQRMPRDNFDLNDAEEKMFGITQMVPFPGKLSLKGKIAKSEAKMAESEYITIERKILSDLKIVYSMYFYANKSIETYKQSSNIMRNFSKVAESKYVVGKVSQGDVLRAQVETSKMLNMVMIMEQEKETIKAELNSLIGKNIDEYLGESEDLLPVIIDKNWEEIGKMVIENNSEIQKSYDALYRSKLSKKYAVSEFLPDFDLTYRKRRMKDVQDTQDFMFGFTIPLWFWRPLYGIKEMSADLKMAESDKKNTELMIIYKAKQIYLKLKTTEKLIDSYKSSILPQAEQSLKVTESLYRGDKEDFLQLLDSIRSLLEFQIEYYKYIAEYHQNLAQLENITGTNLYSGGLK